MTHAEHLLTCLGEEGSEVSQMASKCNRFGLVERSALNPAGPINALRRRLDLPEQYLKRIANHWN